MKKFNLTIFLAYIVYIVNAKDWYETAAFYQIYPQTFFDSGSSVKNGTGDLKGIQQKLNYIKDLGVDCLWLTPIFKSSFRSYGYDITDYMDIDPRYGTKTDFEELIQAVHQNEMKIIVDFVPNHCSDDHEYFQKSIAKDEKFKDWFVWTDKIGDKTLYTPSNWQKIGGPPGSAWTFVPGRKEYFYAQFNSNIPDFNLRNPDVLEYLQSVMQFWLDLNIDGFRIDAISHGVEVKADENGYFENEARNSDVVDVNNFGYLHHNLTQDQPELFDIVYDWRAFLNKYQTDKGTDAKIIMTESYSPPNIIKKYYTSDDGSRDGAHLPFNFQMINKINTDSQASDFVSMVEDWFKVVPKGKVTNWVIGNHDQPRAASRFGESRIDILNTLVTMLPGTSVTYYGEEIGMTDSCALFGDDPEVPAVACDVFPENWSDSFARSPMQWDDTNNAGFSDNDPWIPVSKNYKTVNVKAQTGKTGSHLEIYRQLLKLRKHKAIMESESFEIKALGNNSFGFIRELVDVKQQSIFVVINFGNATEKVDIKNAFTAFPSYVTVEITGGTSKFKKGQVVSTNEVELNEFESIVAFYNTSVIVTVSNIALALLFFVVYISQNLN